MQGVLANADDILLMVVQIGAPIIGALLVTDVTLGVISRSVPQMNVFMVGMPLKIIIALGGSAILRARVHRAHQLAHRPDVRRHVAAHAGGRRGLSGGAAVVGGRDAPEDQDRQAARRGVRPVRAIRPWAR